MYKGILMYLITTLFQSINEALLIILQMQIKNY